MQLTIHSETKHFSKGSVIADNQEYADGLVVITNGYVNVQLPSETDEAHEENRKYGNNLLYVLERGYVSILLKDQFQVQPSLSIHRSQFFTNYLSCLVLPYNQRLLWRVCYCWGQSMDRRLWCTR